jgi:hypothetical protein
MVVQEHEPIFHLHDVPQHRAKAGITMISSVEKEKTS